MRETNLSLPLIDGVPVRLEAKTSERSDGSLMLGRWDKRRTGRVNVRLDMVSGAARQPAVAFNLEMN